MNGYITGGRSTILKIMDDLRDRYKDVFAILKELIQNADDAGAESLALDLRDGLPGTSHPLLSAPGLLICNDGRYSRDNENGIKSVSASSKASDLGSAGRFGLGLKAVHHLCDAFLVVALGHAESFDALLLNPYVALDPVPEAAGRWDVFSRLDAQHLSDAVDRAAFPGRVLAFWLPLRRDGLRPAPKMGFTTRIFEDDASRTELMGELDRPAALAVMLAATRHLRRLDLRRDGMSVTSLRRSGAHMRLPAGGGHEGADGEWPIDGVVTVDRAGGSREARVSGLAVLSADQELKDIKASEGWPNTPDLYGRMVAEKAEPHGACVLVHGEAIAPDPSAPRLLIAEGTFLPLGSPAGPIGIPRLHLSLFLHGYYFVDPGRRGIVGLDDDAAGGDDPRKRWNRALRTRVVMPLIPRVLLRATKGGVLASTELGAVVRALQKSDWFERHGAAICGGGTLAEVWDDRALTWGCFAPATKLRPLPAKLLGEPRRLAALLPELAAFARGRGLTVCAADDDGTPRALAGRSPAWEPEELVALIGGVRADALRRPNGAKDFAALLAVAHVPRAPDREVGRALRAKLREALRSGEANRAEDDSMTAILRHVPRGAVVFLLKAAVNAEILAALAAVEVDALVVGASWRPDGAVSLIEDRSSVAPLLRALEPLATADGEDRSATGAAVAIADASRMGVSGIATDRELNSLKLFPATLQPTNERKILSVQDFAAAAKRGTLFIGTPTTNTNATLLSAAVPGASFYTIRPNDDELFRNAVGPEGPSGTLDGAALVGFVNRAMDFSDDAGARGALLRRLGDVRADDEIRATRRLVAGRTEAGPHEAKLFSDVPAALKRLVESIMRSGRQQGASAFVADEKALGDAGPERRKLLRLIPMLGPDLEHLLQRWPADGTLEATPDEGEALLACGLLADDAFDDLLRALPIHAPDGGGRSVTGEGACRASARSMPPALDGLLKRVAPARDAAARTRQERLLPPHDAVAELRAAVRAPHDRVGLREVILDALAGVDATALRPDLLDALRTAPWLSIDGHTVAPREVLVLPEAVGRAAQAALTDGTGAPLNLVGALPGTVREHRGFIRHRDALLPDARASFACLAETIGRVHPVGLPVVWDEAHREDLAALAAADLRLPAWRLAAALLDERDHAGAVNCLWALEPARSVQHLGTALNALAEAAGWPAVADAARRLYRAAFKQGVHAFDAAERRRLFGAVEVLTAAGTWKAASEVALSGAGLSPSSVLHGDLAEAMRVSEEHNAPDLFARRVTSAPADTEHNSDMRSAEEFRRLLTPLRGHIDDDLALTLLGVAGRFPAMRDVMTVWQGSQGDATRHLDAMDEASKTGCGPRHVEAQSHERRFRLAFVLGADVPAIALSGTRFTAHTTDDAPLVIGNAHEEGTIQGGVFVHTLQIQESALRGKNVEDTIEGVRRLVRAMVGCWPRRSDSLRSADHFPGMQGRPSQALLGETQAALREDLPTLLKQLKTTGRPALHALVGEYDRDSDKRRSLGPAAPSGARAQAEVAFWNGLMKDDQARGELLDCVRRSLENFAYDPERVIFELYQNADDATSQQRDAGAGPRAFRLRSEQDSFDAIHWGRPINDRGRDHAAGTAQNYHRDLRNMLMLHASDKDGKNTTGRYGIGFKSVHLLSRDVRIASGLLATRIVGGLLPEAWPEGPDEAVKHQEDGRPATLIRVPFEAGSAEQCRRAIERFAASAPYLPLFARALRRVEVDGEIHERGEDRPVDGVAGAHLVTVEGRHGFRALVLDLGEGFTLAMRIGGAGPVPFPKEALRLWWTAPLGGWLDAGWMLNGPFTLSANRVALADGAEARDARFNSLGAALGRRLLDLYEAAEADWDRFSGALYLDRDATLPRFAACLWDLFGRDLGDETAATLHGCDRGLGALAAAVPVVPAGRNGACPIRVGEGDKPVSVFVGALCDLTVQDAVAGWDAAADFRRVVDEATARVLEDLGFEPPQRIKAEEVLRRELEAVKWRVSPELAVRLGTVFALQATNRPPLEGEGEAIRRLAARATFLDRSEVWRHVRELTIPRQGDDAEDLRAAFAPDEHILADPYGPDALPFVLLARTESGYSPTGKVMLGWARNAATFGARVATLRYLITMSPWDSFASGFRSGPPNWAEPLDGLPRGPLTAGWTVESLNRLRAVLQDYRSLDAFLPRGAAVEPDIPVRARSTPDILEAIWRWWDENRADLAPRYEDAVYPAGFRPSALPRSQNRIDLHDREGWFTLLALACFQGSGRTRDAQHRTFIESKARNWWAELAQAPPEQDLEVWIARLKEWAEDDDLRYWEWRRRLIDLYRIARWLPEYARAVTLLPKAVMAAGPAAPTLRELLAPGASPVWQGVGLEAASLCRTLGLGANWIVRELVRTGFWQGEEAVTMAPYGWASTGRVRSLMRRLHHDIGEKADMDLSCDICSFVSAYLPHRRADLRRDGDLPLQIITREEHRSDLDACFSDPPQASHDEADDDEDEDAILGEPAE